MDDPDPSLSQAVPTRWSAEYQLAYDAAFDVLRFDLDGVRGDPDAEMYNDALYVLGRLEQLKSLYRSQIDAKRDGYVPSDISNWTLADEVRILRHLAVVIHDHRLSEAALGDEYLLRKFWEYGYLRSVESMCHDARQDLATARSGDLKWLMENWAPRQASEAADLTSRQPVPIRRARRRALPEQLTPAARRSKAAATMRGSTRRYSR